jgi:hypothetical protein
MISRTTFCSAQAPAMRLARTGPMPSTSRRRSGSASMTSNTFRIDRANAADHARAEVLLDAFGRSGGRGLEEPGLELLAMGAIVCPIACGRNPLAGGNHGGVANNGDEIAMPPRLDPNDAKAVVGILVGDAFNQPSQQLPIGWLRLHLHDVYRTGFVAKTLALVQRCVAIERPTA